MVGLSTHSFGSPPRQPSIVPSSLRLLGQTPLPRNLRAGSRGPVFKPGVDPAYVILFRHTLCSRQSRGSSDESVINQSTLPNSDLESRSRPSGPPRFVNGGRCVA